MLTIQPSTVPRGVDLQMQVNPETDGCQIAYHAICVHSFVVVRPERLNSQVLWKYLAFYVKYEI